VNYRSVVVLGKAEKIENAEDKLEAMRKFVEYVIRGRWETVRPPSENELKATMVLAVPLVEVSAKTRTGFAVDDGKEYDGGAWTGVLPFAWTPGTPIADPRAKARNSGACEHPKLQASTIIDGGAWRDQRYP